ncbi:amidohydrolase family protein [bacterium]|nr:amidohydrolase family protein [bacterium]
MECSKFSNAQAIFIDGRFVSGKDLLISDGIIHKITPRVYKDKEKIGTDAVFDLKGKYILPALWDVHVHFFQTGIRMIEFDGGKFITEEDLMDGMSDWLLDHNMINGYGYSPFEDGELPTRNVLDGISLDKPIFLRRIDGHSSCLNSRAIEMMSARLDVVADFDEIHGWLFGEAHISADRYILSQIPKDKLVLAAKSVSEFALSKGCGAIGALVPSVEWMKILLELNMPIRIFPRLETLDPSEAEKLGLTRVGGCMPMVDGALGSHSALLTEPYSDRPFTRGVAEITQKDLNIWFEASGRLNLSTATHAIGDGAVDMILRAVSRMPEANKPPKIRIEHAELLRDDQIEAIAELGISLAVQPVFEKLWGGSDKLYARRLGPRWRMTNRYRDLRSAGISIAGSSDSYITPIDPLDGIFSAVDHPNEDQRITLSEAISMFCSEAAKSEGVEDGLGSINIGQSADFIVLSKMPEKGDYKIEATLIDGRIEYGEING